MSARRAVLRWSARLFRREWRQQLLLLALITVAVGAAVFGTALAYHAPSPQNSNFGRANFRARFDGDPAGISASLDDIRASGTAIEVIGRREVRVPGSTESLDVRAQDPHGRYGAPLLALRAGRYPTGPGEVAMTGSAAALLDTSVGETTSVGRASVRVVGIVENPTSLTDRFVLEPTGASPPQAVDVLFDGVLGNLPVALRPGGDRVPGRASVTGLERRGHLGHDNVAAAAIAFALGTVIMLLVALVAAAGFVVVAQRRSRQLGMMAATGASDRHLRLVLVGNGVLVGAAAAVAGTLLALLVWIVEHPALESLVGHRFARFDIPWWIVASGAGLAVVTAAAAAWWPARVVSRTPIVRALSGRPPDPRPVHRSGLVGLVVLAAGLVALSTGIDTKHDHANPFLVVAGTVATAVGILLSTPAAIRLCARASARLPVAPRLALRDLTRYQARSSAALAAISLGLGIAVAVIAISAAAEPTPATGNLSSHQMLLRLDTGNANVFIGKDPASAPAVTAAELDVAHRAVTDIVTSVHGGTVVPLEGAAVVGRSGGKLAGAGAAGVVRETGQQTLAFLTTRINAHEYRGGTILFVATAELLRYLHVDPAVAASADILTSQTGDLALMTNDFPPPMPAVTHIDTAAYDAAPHALITERGMQRYNLQPTPSGWFLDAPHAITSAEAAQARRTAAASNLAVEQRDVPPAFARTRTVATVIGVLLALGILSMTVGLIRSEATADLRTLTATGATSRTRRSLTATTAGALAFLGAAVGAAGAYAALFAGYLDKLKPLGNVPVPNLLTIVVGVPVLAAAAGWLLAGREPPAVARQPLAT